MISLVRNGRDIGLLFFKALAYDGAELMVMIPHPSTELSKLQRTETLLKILLMLGNEIKLSEEKAHGESCIF